MSPRPSDYEKVYDTFGEPVCDSCDHPMARGTLAVVDRDLNDAGVAVERWWHPLCSEHDSRDGHPEGRNPWCLTCISEAPNCPCGGAPDHDCPDAYGDEGPNDSRDVHAGVIRAFPPSFRTPGESPREVVERAPGSSSSSIDVSSRRAEAIATRAAPIHPAGALAMATVARMRGDS